MGDPEPHGRVRQVPGRAPARPRSSDGSAPAPTQAPLTAAVLKLQRNAGNAAVSRLLGSAPPSPSPSPSPAASGLPAVQRGLGDWVPWFLGGSWGATPASTPTAAVAVEEPVAEEEPTPPAKAPAEKPVTLSSRVRKELTAMAAKLTALADANNKVQKGPDGRSLLETRKSLAAVVKKALDTNALPSEGLADLRGGVNTLEASYAESVRAFDKQAASSRLAAEKEAAATLAAEALLNRLKSSLGKSLPSLETKFSLATLDVLVERLGGPNVISLSGVVKTPELEVLAGDGFSTAQLRALLVDTAPATVVKAAQLVPSGAVLVQLRSVAATEDAFMTNVFDASTGDLDSLKQGATDEATTAGSFQTAFDAELVAQGLIGRNRVRINWMPETAISGDKGAGKKTNNEQTAVTNALELLDTGHENTPPAVPPNLFVRKIEKRVKYENRDGHLPGLTNAVDYQEYGIAPPVKDAWPARRRLVVDKDNDRTYYSWTHYGDGATPAFVRIR